MQLLFTLKSGVHPRIEYNQPIYKFISKYEVKFNKYYSWSCCYNLDYLKQPNKNKLLPKTAKFSHKTVQHFSYNGGCFFDLSIGYEFVDF